MPVGRAHDGCGRQLRDGDVVGMTVRTERIEGDDDLRPDPSNVAGDLLARLGSIGAIQLAVEIIQQADFTHAELARRRAQLGFPGLSDNRRPRRCALVVESAPFTARRRDDEGLDAFSRVFRENPSRPERLIVGMGKHAHQPELH